jgi:hypothetical protein
VACGCQKNRKRESQGDLLRGAGGYLEMRYGDDGIAYGGDRAEEQVIIVGRRTEEERVFTKDQLAEASAYAREVRKTLISQPASVLPRAAMLSLFRSDGGEVSPPIPGQEEGDQEVALQPVE